MTQRKSARVTKRMILMRMCYRSEGFTGGANASPFFLRWWEGRSRNHFAKRGSIFFPLAKTNTIKIGKW